MLRAWYPVIFQVLGVAILCIASLSPYPWSRLAIVALGLLIWLVGFGYRKSN